MIDLDWVSEKYKGSSTPAEKVRDFLAGITDRYFDNTFKQITTPPKDKRFQCKITCRDDK